jgi:hypothetical protein
MSSYAAIKRIVYENPGLTTRDVAARIGTGNPKNALRRARRDLAALHEEGGYAQVDGRWYNLRHHQVPTRRFCGARFECDGVNFTCALAPAHGGEHEPSASGRAPW